MTSVDDNLTAFSEPIESVKNVQAQVAKANACYQVICAMSAASQSVLACVQVSVAMDSLIGRIEASYSEAVVDELERNNAQTREQLESQQTTWDRVSAYLASETESAHKSLAENKSANTALQK